MKVCLTHSLNQFEHSSKVKVAPIIIIIAGLDKLPGKDIKHIDNVAHCHDGDELGWSWAGNCILLEAVGEANLQAVLGWFTSRLFILREADFISLSIDL